MHSGVVMGDLATVLCPPSKRRRASADHLPDEWFPEDPVLLIQASNSKHVARNSGGLLSLRVLSLRDCPFLGDQGLLQIAIGCPLLEELHIFNCPEISDGGVSDIAGNCHELSTMTIKSCPKVGDRGLLAVSSRNLKSVSLADCPLTGDRGVAGFFSSAQKIKLESLRVSEAALAVAGLRGESVAELALHHLNNVSERGFWLMASAGGLGMQLTRLTIASCDGFTDMSLQAAATGFPLLRNLCLRRCRRLSDSGLKAFATASGSLETLRLEDCHRFSLVGVLDALSSCSGSNLKTLSLVGCMGARDGVEAYLSGSYPSLRFLTVRRCRGLDDSGLETISTLCPRLQHLDLRGNVDITGLGVRRLIENVDPGLVEIDLSWCVNVTDEAVSALAARHGESLRALNLASCERITDRSLVAIAEFGATLRDLDASRCAVTDEGVAALASSGVLDLQVLSLSGCQRISEHSVPYLSSLGLSLMGLGLQQCSSIGSGAMSALQNSMWWCDILC